MTASLVHKAPNGELTTTSEIVAEGVGIQHKNVLETIRKNQSDFEEFGPIAFETRKGAPLPQGGYGKATTTAILNREQAMFAMTLFRNAPVVVEFKKNLIKAFVTMERQLERAKQAPALSGKALMAKALVEAQSMLQELEEQNISQRLALVEAQPKIDYHDTFVADSDTLRFSAVASTLGMKESELRELLIKHEWIYRETYTRYSRSQGRKVPVHRYSETAHKKRHFFRKLNHDAPRFRDEVMHTLKITPEGATAIERAVKKWRGAQTEIEAA